jgi:dihydroorotase
LKLVTDGIFSLSDLVRKLSVNPAAILKISRGTLSTGADADITIIDLNLDWTVKAAESKSKSKNTPFDGWKLRGKAVQTIVGGRL